MTGGSKTTSTTVSDNKIDPALMSLYQQNYQSAQGVANLPFQPFTGEAVSPINATQRQATGIFGNLANASAPTINAGLLKNTDLSPYMNPFQSQVIDRTLQAQERARQMAQVTQNQAATSAGAFGGSRSGVLGALTNEGYDRNTADLIANLNAQNFGQAQAAATGDINRIYGADTTNATNVLNNNQQRLAATGGLNLAGAQEQQTAQSADDAAYQEFLRRIGYPSTQQDIRNASLGLIPLQQTQNSTTTQKQSGGGLAGILGAIGSVGRIFGG